MSQAPACLQDEPSLATAIHHLGSLPRSHPSRRLALTPAQAVNSILSLQEDVCSPKGSSPVRQDWLGLPMQKSVTAELHLDGATS